MMDLPSGPKMANNSTVLLVLAASISARIASSGDLNFFWCISSEDTVKLKTLIKAMTVMKPANQCPHRFSDFVMFFGIIPPSR